MSAEPELTIAVCSHNPDRVLLSECLTAIAVSRGGIKAEVVVVDNASEPRLSAEDVLAAGPDRLRLVREPRQGLIFARARAIREAGCDVICFVDDDNVIDPDFIVETARIAREEPSLGVWAGRARGRFGRLPGPLARHYISRYAVRDHGAEPITGPGDAHGPWSPIGAGMAVRKPIAVAYATLAEGLREAGLGHAGGRVGAGEDTLFALIAARLGYQVGYRPGMALEHVIPAPRFTMRYLSSLLRAQGRSEAILARLSGEGPGPVARWSVVPRLCARFALRLRSPGWREAAGHLFWDLGWFDARIASAEPEEAALKSGLERIAAAAGAGRDP